MVKQFRFIALAGVLLLAVAIGVTLVSGSAAVRADSGGLASARVEQESTRVSYVVFHALDRDGFCDAEAFGAVSLHPVLTDAPNDTMVNGATGLPNPRATLDVFIDSGEGVIVETNDGPVAGQRAVVGLTTFSIYDNAQSGSPIRAFAPLQQGAVDECQAWVKIVSSLPGPTNVLMVFHDDTGDIGFDRVINSQRATKLTLAPRWSLVTWSGPTAPVGDALAGTGAAAGGSNVSGQVTAVYGWDSAAAKWLAYFPGGASIPGANTLANLKTGQAYWVAISGASPLDWSVAAAP